MSIPLLLIYFTRKRDDLKFRAILYLFAAFITFCGWTHFLAFWTFEHPWMRLDGLVKLATAAVSWATVFVLAPLVPKALLMRSPAHLEREVHRRTAELEDLNKALRASREEALGLNVRLQRAMSETHHRVKNNLQIVSALVDMQAMDHPQAVPTAEIARISQHIRVLSVLHDLLTHQSKTNAETDKVSLESTVTQLAPILRQFAMSRSIHFSVDDVHLPIGQATSCALLLNELVSNAVKHSQGDIRVRAEAGETTVRLSVSDDGPGFPAEFDAQASESTGLALVESVATWDLGGKVTYENDPSGGGRVTVEFPKLGETPELRNEHSAEA